VGTTAMEICLLCISICIVDIAWLSEPSEGFSIVRFHFRPVGDARSRPGDWAPEPQVPQAKPSKAKHCSEGMGGGQTWLPGAPHSPGGAKPPCYFPLPGSIHPALLVFITSPVHRIIARAERHSPLPFISRGTAN
jgi:hypothetical protein